MTDNLITIRQIIDGIEVESLNYDPGTSPLNEEVIRRAYLEASAFLGIFHLKIRKLTIRAAADDEESWVVGELYKTSGYKRPRNETKFPAERGELCILEVDTIDRPARLAWIHDFTLNEFLFFELPSKIK